MPFEVERVALACDPEELLTANEVETPALSDQGPVEGVKKAHGFLVVFFVWEAVDSFEDGLDVHLERAENDALKIGRGID
jgi:hypothetical protein